VIGLARWIANRGTPSSVIPAHDVRPTRGARARRAGLYYRGGRPAPGNRYYSRERPTSLTGLCGGRGGRRVR